VSTHYKQPVELTREQINEICDLLIGTPHSIDYAMQILGIMADPDELGTNTLIEFDQRFFVCDLCGWTCDIDECVPGDGLVCDECDEDATRE